MQTRIDFKMSLVPFCIKVHMNIRLLGGIVL